MGGWVDGWMGGWVDGWMDGWMDRRTDGRTDGRTGGRTDGWMDRQIDRKPKTKLGLPQVKSICFVNKHTQKLFWVPEAPICTHEKYAQILNIRPPQ